MGHGAPFPRRDRLAGSPHQISVFLRRSRSEALSNVGLVTRGSIRDLVEAYAQSRDPLYFAPEAVLEQVSLGRLVRGRTAIGAMLRALYLEAFSEVHEELRRVVVDDTRRIGVVESLFTGRHAHETLGLPLTGGQVKVPIVGVYEIEERLIVRGRLYFDVATLLGRFAESHEHEATKRENEQ
ncbi:MAG: ester cyclase [Chloroflexi bacterium]|nr:MAG: ester cyclase [Chloroflexota bacterium]TMB75888.1 MAG: ester cyclase [Chloroflexota bacterium]TMC35236.1 MAG: ester cyclase [Chloroflexota bacterium]TME35758.1 MAG: ester cyclase [Chloroflexota bacterium]